MAPSGPAGSTPLYDAVIDAWSHRSSRSRLALLGGVLAAFLVVSACGSDPSDSSGALAGRTDGPSLYAATCALCHGTDLRGTQTGPSLLSAVYEPSHHPDASFTAAVRKGVIPHHWKFAPMPPITGLSDDQITAIVAFVRQTQQREGFEPYPPG